ncbi:MAG: D-alanine--D-alanine ligase [Clostridia bacterium]|nr:D-alanine--D-alanine ligase [Clostridia bacterium]
MNKLTVAVIFGGQSSEHEVSRVSASSIISNLDPEKYYVIPVGITKSGKWMIYNGPVENIKNGEWEKFGTPAILSPDASQKGLLKIVGGKVKLIPIDLAFPVLHGKYGEDGTIQGLFELAQIPYVGNGVLSSSVSMDKAFTKIIAKSAKIPQAKYVEVRTDGLKRIKTTAAKIERKLGYPCFVKPANAGSSVGITKAHNRDELIEGLKLAAVHDSKIVVEKAIVGREIECAVLGNGSNIQASCVGEILAAAEFYDYDAKYNNSESKTVVPADISPEKQDEIRNMAIKVFKAVDGNGLARIDFFVEKDTENVIFNELNTLPGFTPISMYSMLWAACGKPIGELLDELIDLALERFGVK